VLFFYLFFGLGGPKLLQLQNLEEGSVIFFKESKSQLRESLGAKTAIKSKIN